MLVSVLVEVVLVPPPTPVELRSLTTMVMTQLMLLQTLLQLMLVGQAGRVSELLLLRRLVMVRTRLSVSHPRVVEVVMGQVDVTHMTSSVHHHRTREVAELYVGVV